MRAYLAVIKDSFREALASRVLWILLVLSTLMLLALAPLALKEQRATQLQTGTIFDWPGLIEKIKAQASATEPAPGKRIWDRLTEDARQRLAELPEKPTAEQLPADLTRGVLDGLNKILNDRVFYDDAAWRGIEFGAEEKELLTRGVARLSKDDVARLNRLLLEAAFPAEVARSTKSDIHVAYFGWTLGDSLPVTRSQVNPFVKTILASFMNFFVGTLAVFAAILVTAPVIPHTFEAGAIDLLLSKPVSRSLLFLAKFVGGCAFILLNAAYFISGLWLILGVRFDLWSGKLLLCIPIFMFLFAIYYSVSALAGVLWRNAVVSIVITILFWVACFAVGTTKNVIEQVFLNPNRIVKLVPAGESLLGVNEEGHVLEWRAAQRKWEQVMVGADSPANEGPFRIAPPMFGPVYDARTDRILAIRMPWPGGFRLTMPDSTLLIGNRSDGWTRSTGAAPPRDLVAMFVNPVGEIVLVTRQGIFRVEGDLEAKPRQMNLLGLKVPLGKSQNPFVAIGPEPPLRLATQSAAAMSAESGALAIWSHGSLIILQRDESGKYQQVNEREFEGEAKAAVLSFGGSTLVAALVDGRIWIIDARDLELRHEFKPEASNQPRFVHVAPGGRWFAIVFHHHKLWLFDADHDQAATRGFTGRDDISAATFTDSNRLLLADRGTRVTEYELEPFRVATERVPEMGTLDRVYRFTVLPIYTVFPKPGELGNMVAYLLTDQETTPLRQDSDDLGAARIKLNVKGPVWSSLTFTVLVLALTCLYIRRADF